MKTPQLRFIKALLRLRKPVERAFSLIEVTLTLGVTSFAMIAVIGLLPISFAVARDTGAERRATECMSALAACLRGATQSGGSYTPLAPFSLVPGWNAGGSTVSTVFYVDAQGKPSAQRSGDGQVVAVRIVPAPGVGRNHHAFVTVAWPESADVTWQGANLSVSNAAGSAETAFYFNADNSQ